VCGGLWPAREGSSEIGSPSKADKSFGPTYTRAKRHRLNFPNPDERNAAKSETRMSLKAEALRLAPALHFLGKKAIKRKNFPAHLLY